MTMTTSWAKGDQFVLFTFDDRVFIGHGDGGIYDKWEPAPENMVLLNGKKRPKVVKLNDRVLMGIGGDVFLGDGFKQHFKVPADADLQAAYEMAQARFRLLQQLPEEFKRHVNFTMAGFLEDGTAAIASFDTELGDHGITRADAGSLEGVPLASQLCCPYGADYDTIISYCRFLPGTVANESDLGGCFWHAFNGHHLLRKHQPDRVSKEMHLSVLFRPTGRQWSGETVHFAANVDCSGIEAAARIYQTLQDMEYKVDWETLAAAQSAQVG